jgi:hypothetical protein
MKKLFILFAFFGFLAANTAQARNIWVLADSINFIYAQLTVSSNLTNPVIYNIPKSSLQITQTAAPKVILNYGNPNSNTLTLSPGVVASGSGDSITWNGATLGGSTSATTAAHLANLLRQAINSGYKYAFNRATTWTTIKSIGGVLHTINVDSVGAGGIPVFSVYDGTDTTTTSTGLIGDFSTTTLLSRTLDVKFSKGLYIKQKSTTPCRITISYYLIDPEEFNALAPDRY